MLSKFPRHLAKDSKKMDCFLHGYAPQKQGNIITYPILSGLHNHYKAFSLSSPYSILPYFIISIAKPSYIFSLL